MEKLLHYVWKHRILPLRALETTDGKSVEVIDPGMHNANQGPDFFNAKVKIEDTVWAGNVEIHLHSSDWFRHGHNLDANYDNIILHVVGDADMEIDTKSGRHPAQLQLDIPDSLRLHYNELCQTDDYPRCYRLIPQLDPLKAHGWLDVLLVERLAERSQRVLKKVEESRGDWELATFVTLCRNFGFGLNGDAFERWAKMIPLQAMSKHRDSLFQIEAVFLGMAGLIDECTGLRGEDGVAKLHREFVYLSHKFSLPAPMEASQWKYLRTRPKNFPHIRLLQIAQLYQQGNCGTSRLLEAKDVKALHQCFGGCGMSQSSRQLLVINTVVPLLYAYGQSHHDEHACQKAIAFLTELPAEDNFILRQWSSCGLKVKSAADSQALIQLKREYCDRKDCLRCRFGYEYLKQK